MEKNKYKDHNCFQRHWDFEVTNRYNSQALEGDDSVLLIYCTCFTDLEEYRQVLKEQAALSATASTNNEVSKDVANTPHDTSLKTSSIIANSTLSASPMLPSQWQLNSFW
jgi:hypothetical protein